MHPTHRLELSGSISVLHRNAPNSSSVGAPPQTPLGSLQRSLDPLAGFKGPTSKGMEGGEGKGREEGKGRGGERRRRRGEGRKEGEGEGKEWRRGRQGWRRTPQILYLD